MARNEAQETALKELAHALNMSFEYCLKFNMTEREFITTYGKGSFIHLREVGLVMVVNRQLHEVRFNVSNDHGDEIIVKVNPLTVIGLENQP